MTEKSEKYLSDMLMAIDLIEEFTTGVDFTALKRTGKLKAPLKDKWLLFEKH